MSFANFINNFSRAVTGNDVIQSLNDGPEEKWNVVCSSAVGIVTATVVGGVTAAVTKNKNVTTVASITTGTAAAGFAKTHLCPSEYENGGKDFINPTSSTDPTMADDFQNDYQGAIEKFNENKKKLSNLDNADVVEAGEEAATNQEAVEEGAEGTDVAEEKNNTTPDDPAKKNAAA